MNMGTCRKNADVYKVEDIRTPICPQNTYLRNFTK